ncbi:hypothetical protein, partial [Proteus mirabilis]|uniref:hypothetical protein n=1 Tax=Proteus mirabilis TaxID=584 RepID=UPI0019534EE0
YLYNMKQKIQILLLLLTTSASFVHAQKKKVIVDPTETLKTATTTSLDSKYDQYKNIALRIWDFAEVGYKEVKSSA